VKIDKTSLEQIESFNSVTELVSHLLSMNQQKAFYPHEEDQLKNLRIEIEKEINKLICDLYGLDSEETRIVCER